MLQLLFQNGTLQTTIYKKPTDQKAHSSQTYFHKNSNHSKHIKKAVIYSQVPRYISSKTTCDTQLKTAFNSGETLQQKYFFKQPTQVPTPHTYYNTSSTPHH